MSAHSESEPVGKSDRVLRGQEVKGDMVDAPTGKLFGKSKTKVKEESKYDERGSEHLIHDYEEERGTSPSGFTPVGGVGFPHQGEDEFPPMEAARGSHSGYKVLALISN